VVIDEDEISQGGWQRRWLLLYGIALAIINSRINRMVISPTIKPIGVIDEDGFTSGWEWWQFLLWRYTSHNQGPSFVNQSLLMKVHTLLDRHVAYH